MSGSATSKSSSGFAAAERFVGSDVGEHVVADRHVGEVDDQVGPLGQPHQQPVAVAGGEVDRGFEEAALVADRPHLDAGDLVEVEDEEPGLAAVEDPEPVAALLDGLERPGVAVDDDHVAEELRVPDRRDVGVGDVRAGDSRRRTLGCRGRTATRSSLNERSWMAIAISR